MSAQVERSVPTDAGARPPAVLAALETLRRDVERAMAHKTAPIHWARLREELRARKGADRRDGRR